MPAPFVLSSDLVSAYPAKSVTLADYIDTSLAAKSDLAMVQNAQTGSSYSYALADASKLLTMSNASANTVLVTKQATVTWVTGTQLRVMNLGAGVTTLVADTGVTINGNVALKQYQGGTLIRTASDVWLFVPTSSAGGMDLITPTSVAGTGVTLSGGQISFSAATSVSVNGVFTSAYANYKVIFEGVGSAVDVNKLRLRLSGTDASGANYSYEQVTGSNTSVSAQNYSGETAWSYFAASTTVSMMSEVLIRRPNLAETTMISGQGGRENAVVMMTGVHSLTSQYDGFSLLPGSGNITGTLRVYGMRNS